MTACSYTPAANRVPKANGSGLLASGWFAGIFAPTGPITTSGLTVSATDKVLGRQSASGGAIEEITCTAAGRALLDDANAAAQRVTLGLGPSDSVTFDILTATTRLQSPVLRATSAAGVQVQASTGTLCATFGLSGSPCAVFADGASFAGQVNVTHSSGVITQQAATQDAIQILGRAGGTNSYIATLQPPTLTGSIIITLPAATTDLGTAVLATSAFGTDNRILRSDLTGRLAQSSAITVDDSGNLSGAASVVIGTDPTGSELLRVGGAIHNNGVIKCDNTANATSHTDTSASLSTAGGLAVTKDIYLGGFIDRQGHRLLHQGYTWASRTSAADNNWNSVCYGNGLFVAVATSGTGNRVMTSPDGITWTSRTSAADNDWYSVCYGNGLFVAVSYTGTGNRVMTSPDGITWTSRTSAADNNWISVCYGNGLFVAVSYTGTGNRVMTSPDGITWTSRTSAADNAWYSVCYGNGLFVAVATSGTGNRVMTSPDGITWTSRTSAADNDWFSVCYGNGLFVAAATSGTGNRVMTSPDGITWTSRTSAADNAWYSVCYGNGLFVAVATSGTGNRVMTSGYTYRTDDQKTVIRGYDTTDATDKDTGAIVTEGGIASEKVQFSQTGHNVANKFRIHYDSSTGEQGLQVKLTNKTGGNTVKGTIVSTSTGTDMAFMTAPANSDAPFGVVYEAGIADAAEAWVWVEGAVCQVLLQDTTASTRGYWAQVSSTAGRADITNAAPVPATHPQEIGHCLESKTAGTNVLARIYLHTQ